MSRGKAHYDYDYYYNLHFFILYDISSAVENYFQKIFRPPEKIHSPFFTHSWPSKHFAAPQKTYGKKSSFFTSFIARCLE